MDKSAKIYVAGHRGLVGSAMVKQLKNQGYNNLLFRTRSELDLTDSAAVSEFFQSERPDYVIDCAAKVGGINANRNMPAEFYFQNTTIQHNIIHNSYVNGVKRLLFLGSSCIFPKMCPQPMKEEYLLSGHLEFTNRAYAIAKIAGIEMCWAYNRQYGTQYLAAMPTNLYGPGDNYDLENSHVLPAIVRKMHEAKGKGNDKVILWGTGKPKREFLYNDDLAKACVFLMNLDQTTFDGLLADEKQAPLVNVGCGEDLTIADLAETIKDVVGFEGDIVYDSGMPDGTPRKLLDVSKLQNLGWKPSVSLQEGIENAYHDFKARMH